MAVGALGGGAVITSLLSKSGLNVQGLALTSAAALVACVEPSEASLAISACYLFRAIGQVVGVAIAAAIQQSVLARSLADRLGEYPADLIRGIIEEPSRVIPLLDEAVRWQARMAYLRSIDGVFAFVVAGGIALSIVCLLIRAKPL